MESSPRRGPSGWAHRGYAAASRSPSPRERKRGRSRRRGNNHSPSPASSASESNSSEESRSRSPPKKRLDTLSLLTILPSEVHLINTTAPAYILLSTRWPLNTYLPSQTTFSGMLGYICLHVADSSSSAQVPPSSLREQLLLLLLLRLLGLPLSPQDEEALLLVLSFWLLEPLALPSAGPAEQTSQVKHHTPAGRALEGFVRISR